MRGEDELVEADPEGGLRPPDEVPEVEAAAYADNWGVTTLELTAVGRAVTTIVQLCSALRLTLATSKSWLWGTTKQSRKELRRIRVDGEPRTCGSGISEFASHTSKMASAV